MERGRSGMEGPGQLFELYLDSVEGHARSRTPSAGPTRARHRVRVRLHRRVTPRPISDAKHRILLCASPHRFVR